ncbi:MAG: cation:proton antiporter [Armatimonadota bacterium]
MDDLWLTAALWMGLALAAGLVSVRLALSISLAEILLGIVGGNFLGLHSTQWTAFLASLGSVMLTFMAGAEIEPQILRRYLKESVLIGFAGFFFPFLLVMLYCRYAAHWTLQASQIGGIALSTTSVAVVYAVMVETGLNNTQLGKVILAACFINDLGTVMALGILFADYNIWLAVMAICLITAVLVMPKLTRWVFDKYSGQVGELETKFLLLVLFALGGVAAKANVEAVLGAYLVGLSVASVFAEQKATVRRIRTMVFALLNPFYFLKAGSLVALKALWPSLGLITPLFLMKIAGKLIGVGPLTKVFRFSTRNSAYTTLLMSTGLTFGTISAMFGYTRGIINQSQYTVLVTVVILTALIPTMIAQAFYRPDVKHATIGTGRGPEAEAGISQAVAVGGTDAD